MPLFWLEYVPSHQDVDHTLLKDAVALFRMNAAKLAVVVVGLRGQDSFDSVLAR